MNKIIVPTVVAVALPMLMDAAAAQGRDQIRIVGSSTVFPFATAVAERFGQQTQFPAPVVESTGTGGGIKLFCEGVGERAPDIANASRRIKQSEFQACTAAGVTPVEVNIGFDGIVLATAKGGLQVDLTREQIFQALARQLPAEGGGLQPNPNQTWSDVDPALPNARIEVLGPPPTSGTRDAFIELVMQEACPDGMEERACTEVREDGAYVDAGENDNLIVQKLQANPNAIGIFGFSFLDQNLDKLTGVPVEGVEPSFENIESGDYPISRSLYFYLKKDHVGQVPGLQEYAMEFTSEAAIGEDGYLVDKGLIPLPEAELEQTRQAVENMTPMSM